MDLFSINLNIMNPWETTDGILVWPIEVMSNWMYMNRIRMKLGKMVMCIFRNSASKNCDTLEEMTLTPKVADDRYEVLLDWQEQQIEAPSKVFDQLLLV